MDLNAVDLNSAAFQNFTTELYPLLFTVASSTDSKVLQNSTSILNKQFFTNHFCFPSLITIATSASSDVPEPVRLLAAVEARKRFRIKDLKVIPECNLLQRNLILERIFVEPNSQIRRALSYIVALIARVVLARNGWDELFNVLSQNVSSTVALHRECSLIILTILFEYSIVDEMEHFQKLVEAVTPLMGDSECKKVRQAAIRCTSVFLEQHKDLNVVAERVETSIPYIIANLQEAIVVGSSEQAEAAFTFLDFLVSLPNACTSIRCVEVIQWLHSIFCNDKVDPEIRVQAANLLILLPFYQNELKECSFVGPMLSNIIDVMNEVPAELQAKAAASGTSDPDVDFEEGPDDNPGFLARQLIDTYANHGPSQIIYPIVCQKIFSYSENSNPYVRRSACGLVRLIASGLCEQIKADFDKFFALTIQKLSDSDPGVRKEACNSLQILAETFEDEVANSVNMFINPLYSCLCENCPAVVASASMVFETVFGLLGEKAAIYIPQLQEQFALLLKSSDNVQVQQSVLSAVGSASFYCSEAFEPYFATFFPTLLNLSSIQSEDVKLIRLRTVAIESLSYFVQGFGAHVFRPHFMQIAASAFEHLGTCLPRVKQCYYDLLGSIIKAFGREAMQISAAIQSFLFASIDAIEADPFEENDNLDFGTNNEQVSTDLSPRTKPLAQNEEWNGGMDDEDDLIDDFDSDNDDLEDMEDDSEDELDGFRGLSAIAEEKATAIKVLGTIFESIGSDFLPILQESTNRVIEATKNFNEEVRAAAVGTLCKFLTSSCTLEMQPMASERAWTVGLPLAKPLSADLSAYVTHLMTQIIAAIDGESEVEAAADMCDSLQSALLIAGPCLIADESVYSGVSDVVRSILRQKHEAFGASRFELEEKETEESDDVDRGERYLLACAGDVVAAMAQVVGPNFAVQSKNLISAICFCFNKVRRSPNSYVRSSLVGSVGEISKALGQMVEPWTENFSKIIKRTLKDNDQSSNSNACYALGCLVSNTPARMDPKQCLSLIYGFLEQQPSQTRDNACGAAARICLRAIRDNQIVAEFKILIDKLLDLLPLQTDHLEHDPIIELFGLIVQHQELFSFIADGFQKMVSFFAHLLANPKALENESKEKLVQVLRTLSKGPLASQFNNTALALGENVLKSFSLVL